MSKLNIDITGKAGLSNNFYGFPNQNVPTPNMLYDVQPGQMVGGFWNPFNGDGFMSPTPSTLHAMSFTGTLGNYCTCSIYDPVSDTFYFGEAGQQLWTGTNLDDTTLVLAKDLGATGSPVFFDLEIYQVNGVKKLFFVYGKGGNLQVGIGPLPYTGSSDDVSWLTSTVNGAFTAVFSGYPFMRVADNGFAYLFADNQVHKIDGTALTGGTNGTVTQGALVFPVYFRLIDAIDYRGNLLIAMSQNNISIVGANGNASNFNNACGVYIWDRQTTQVTMSDYIPIEGIIAIKKIWVAPNGEVRILTISSNHLTQIRRFNGNTFQVIQELGQGASPNFPDGLTNMYDISIWLGTDGSLYAYGPTSAGKKEILAKIGSVETTSTTDPGNTITAGAILFGSASNFTSGTPTGERVDKQGVNISWRKSSTMNLKKLYPFDNGQIDGLLQNALAGNVYTPVAFFPELSKVNYIRVYHNCAATSGSTVQGTLSTYLNQSATSFKDTTISRDDISVGWKYIPVNQGAKNAVFGIQFKIAWDTDATLTEGTMWQPRSIEIDYDPIARKK